MSGKALRLNRFRYRGGRNGLIVPIDHGLTLGPLEGIGSVDEMARWLAHPAICGIIAHKGIAERLAATRIIDGLGLLIHLNGMSTLARDPNRKLRLTSMESAMRLGADGVSLQVNFDGQNDAENLQLLGEIVDEAQCFGLPVLAMIYDKVAAHSPDASLSRQRHLIRLGIELGVDAIKIGPSAETDLTSLLAGLASDVPIFLAGGSVTDPDSLYEMARGALLAGAQGLCVGRNVFQRSDFSIVLSRLEQILRNMDGGVSEFPTLKRSTGYGLH